MRRWASGSFRKFILAAIFAASAAGASAEAKALSEDEVRSLPCSFEAAARNSKGQLNLALLVGINDYAKIRDLSGPINDVGKLYSILVEGEDKVFPAQNVCVLTDAEATYDGFHNAFEKAVYARAKDAQGPADNVVFYFAGHGSQLTDNSKDENDFLDESLLLQDSNAIIPEERTVMVNGQRVLKWPHLRDDALNALLSRLYKDKTKNLVVMLDSCNSGTATRSLDLSPRTVEFDASAEAGDELLSRGEGDGGLQSAGAGFEEAVFLYAAGASESAFERGGAGLFTDALTKALRSSGGKITYDQLVARVRSDLGTGVVKQSPSGEGQTGKIAFTNDIPLRPIFGWEVVRDAENRTGVEVRLNGAATPGVGLGAEFVILPGEISVDDDQASMAKARVRIEKPQARSHIAVAKVIQTFRANERIEAGDIAVLRKPALAARKLRVKVRGPSEPGGVADPATLKDAIMAELRKPDYGFEQGGVIEFVDASFNFEVAMNDKGGLQIADPAGNIRNTPKNAADATRSLVNHLFQLTLLNDWQIQGGSMTPNQTLEVWLEPVVGFAESKSACKGPFPAWTSAGPNKEHVLPLCGIYKIRIKNTGSTTLIIGGSVLSADGERLAFPSNRQPITLAPGAETKPQDLPGVYQATPEMLGAVEHVFVLGLPAALRSGDLQTESNFRIPWNLLSSDATRSTELGAEEEGDEFGTYTALPFRAVVNEAFLASEESDSAVTEDTAASREYTLRSFNVSPYLPDDEDTALHRVLKVADSLTNVTDSGDGYPYTQHKWCKRSDQANLRHGIDCSRAIWYAFTRAGVPYNRHAMTTPDETMCTEYAPEKNGYLITRDMADLSETSLMRDQFESCDISQAGGGNTFQLGDVLVFRDPFRGDGHTVMVIDPKERIAWGSHGWDGSPRFEDPQIQGFPAADLGVEYQKIKVKQDWKRWDRTSMELVACWRHKTFIEEGKSPGGRRGLEAICRMVMKPAAMPDSSVCAPFAEGGAD